MVADQKKSDHFIIPIIENEYQFQLNKMMGMRRLLCKKSLNT